MSFIYKWMRDENMKVMIDYEWMKDEWMKDL